MLHFEAATECSFRKSWFSAGMVSACMTWSLAAGSSDIPCRSREGLLLPECGHEGHLEGTTSQQG